MPQTSELDRVASIVLRLMRRPVLVLFTVYAFLILGMVLIPGRDLDGAPAHMSFFHAFYFLTYTATTTGFGEIPSEFSDGQRLWAIVSLYVSVVAWLYAIGSIIGLVQNPHFKLAVAQRGFSRAVRRITEPFFIVCGFGDTGSLLARGLSDSGLTAVIIDRDPERIKALALRDYRVPMPGLCADASVPRHLIEAGLTLPLCRSVVTLTNDEAVNQKIAVMSRLLNPSARVICRSTARTSDETLQCEGPVTVVDPFEAFAQQLCTALYSPSLHSLNAWLVGAHGVALDEPLRPPMGRWILCGFGRMGSSLYKAMKEHHVPTVVIDPAIEGNPELGPKVVGYATAQSLHEAHIEEAVGVIAATHNDSDNLDILLNARAANPGIFLVVRQNDHENEVAFQAANAALIMQPSLVTARSILLFLLSPLIMQFLDHLREHHDEDVLNDTIRRLEESIGEARPHLWTVALSEADAVIAVQRSGLDVTLGQLLKDPSDSHHTLDCVPLGLQRGQNTTFLPSDAVRLEPEDRLLLCGTRRAQNLLESTIHNPYTLRFFVTGVEEPRSYLMKWLARRQTGASSGQPVPRA